MIIFWMKKQVNYSYKSALISLITLLFLISGLLIMLLLSGCEEKAWNNPYPFDKADANTLYMAFNERPKHLDPARSYAEPEWRFICQIYEPPLEYHYLKRPYQLQPLTAATMPEISYFNQAGEKVSEEAPSQEVIFTEYLIKIKPGIYYQPHPAFAKDENGQYRYLNLTPQQARKYRKLSDFKETGTKELTAEDYVYQIKRLAEPNLSSPIFGVMSKHIEGLAELRSQLNMKRSGQNQNKEQDKDQSREQSRGQEIDLRPYSLKGAEVIDRYTYRIRIHGKYPQFRFWLAMPFFSPVPYEVAQFFAQPGFESRNISLDWYPVGTGPYLLIENNPDRRMVLLKNPNFREEFYPSEGTPRDEEKGLLKAANTKIPSVAKVNYTLERENIPFWNKFLQGYYDISAISSDNFNSAIQFSPHGMPEISPRLREQNIRLETTVSPSIWMWGFNMLDDTLGGKTEKARALRHAINLAFDVQEFIDIFLNGRGVLAHGPIPQDIFGYDVEEEIFNSTHGMSNTNNTNSTNSKNNTNNIAENSPSAPFDPHAHHAEHIKLKQAKIEKARAILKKAGVTPGSIIYLDAAVSGDPDEIAIHSWLSEQFKKIDLQMIMRGSNFNRFQEKLHNGTAQMFMYGWNADYPDPENFLFLFYGPNGAAAYGGENVSNYQNEEYDKLFEEMRGLPDGEARAKIIQKMVEILNRDLPSIWGYYPKAFALYHDWMRITKPTGIINNTLKYAYITPSIRAEYRMIWNVPVIWPLWGLAIIIVLLGIGVWMRYSEKEYSVRGRV